MVTVNLHEAQIQGAPPGSQRLGFLAGEVAVPEDFDSMGAAEITALFESGA